MPKEKKPGSQKQRRVSQRVQAYQKALPPRTDPIRAPQAAGKVDAGVSRGKDPMHAQHATDIDASANKGQARKKSKKTAQGLAEHFGHVEQTEDSELQNLDYRMDKQVCEASFYIPWPPQFRSMALAAQNVLHVRVRYVLSARPHQGLFVMHESIVAVEITAKTQAEASGGEVLLHMSLGVNKQGVRIITGTDDAKHWYTVKVTRDKAGDLRHVFRLASGAPSGEERELNDLKASLSAQGVDGYVFELPYAVLAKAAKDVCEAVPEQASQRGCLSATEKWEKILHGVFAEK